MKVSLIQMNSISDKAANIAAAEALIERAVAEEAPGLGAAAGTVRLGGRLEGRQARQRRDACPAARPMRWRGGRRSSIASSSTPARSWRGSTARSAIHNTSVVFNREGEEIARYRKIHLFDVTTPDGAAYKESATVKAGDAVVTYDCEGVTVGCSICYDLRFPDLFQALAEKGAEMIAMPAAFTMQTGKDHWEVLLRARAIETRDLRLRQRPDRIVHRRQRAAADLWPFARRRPLGPCDRQGLRRGGHRLRPDRSRPGQEGAGDDSGRRAQGEDRSRLRRRRS